ncbi:hypothetical protein [Sphingosinicella sp. BN140058]|uniref:hypothetical protein n=1 Tax=Sphingosinicella sp. BN140058 TaxID=1892855 RepID=UPI001010CE1F|nr:hypothetical protein [Sphingosinicella sp. BN140058]QAY80435.1 hypothetical protein ETR14_27740 [Sphingosinicella sp. BN140058]
MTHVPLRRYPAALELLHYPKVYDRRSLRIVAIGDRGEELAAGDPAAHHFAVLVTERSTEARQEHAIVDFERQADAEPFRRRIAAMLDVDGEIASAAMCLWEEVLKVISGHSGAPSAIRALILAASHNHGACALRDAVQAFAERCDLEWSAAHESGTFDDSFDWEWCPAWLATRVEWDPSGVDLPRVKERTASSEALATPADHAAAA